MESILEQSAPTEFVKVKKAGALKLKKLSDDNELYIFKIPEGLFNKKDLINKEIEIGSKKASQLNINGNKFELVTRPVDGQDVTPWLPNKKGRLQMAPLKVCGIVQARLCLKDESVSVTSEMLERLQHLRPQVHVPPPLPRRDFFAANSAAAIVTMTGNPTNFSGKKFKASAKKRKSFTKTVENNSLSKMKQHSPKTVDANSNSIANIAKTPETVDAIVPNTRVSLDEMTPFVQQKPFKKKKQDKLVSEFQSVFQDICTSPAVSSEGLNGSALPEKRKTSKKRKHVTESPTKGSIDEQNNAGSSDKPKSSKKRKLLDESLHNESVVGLDDSPVVGAPPAKKRRRKDDAATDAVLNRTKPTGLRALYRTQANEQQHSPKLLFVKQEAVSE